MSDLAVGWDLKIFPGRVLAGLISLAGFFYVPELLQFFSIASFLLLLVVFVHELNKINQLPPTIILTTFDDDEMVLSGLKSGAKGYLLKDVPLEDLVDGIKKVAAGETLVRPQITKRILEGIGKLNNDFNSFEIPDPLTSRETEILRLMAGGHSNKEIANSLFVAEGTVKNHVSNILSKIGVRDRTRAVLKSLELGLI